MISKTILASIFSWGVLGLPTMALAVCNRTDVLLFIQIVADVSFPVG